MIAGGIAVTLMFVGEDELRYRAIEYRLGVDVGTDCVRAADRQPPRITAPTPQQEALSRLIARMDDTPTGRTMNASAASSPMLWCAEESNTRFGAYLSPFDVGTLNVAAYGGAAAVMTNERLFNLALRTMYEENAHAWQWRIGPGLSAPGSAMAEYKIAYTLALESAARVTAYTALHEHRLAGDPAPWNHNALMVKNQPMMARMDAVWDADDNRADNAAAHWAGFDAFYDHPTLITAYTNNAQSDLRTRFGNAATPLERFHALGTVPGQTGNYLYATPYEPLGPRYRPPAPSPE